MAHGIEDVARVAGVSTATVSRALRGLPGVAPSTRDQVLRAAHELGYVASPSAASLATGRTRTVGIISPWVNHWFYAEVIEGAEQALREHGFDALLHTFDMERERPRRRLDPGALRRRVDGVIVVGGPLVTDEVRAVEDLGVPVVFVGSGAPGHVLVRLDDERTAREATQHLLDLGHRVVGHVTGPVVDDGPTAPSWWRRLGWARALADAGFTAEGDLEVDGRYDVDGGRASTHTLLARRPDVTAVFAASDEMAMGVVLAARDLGLRVPEDLSVVGVDGHALGELVGLTTMAQPAVRQGGAAVRLLLDRVAGQPLGPGDVVFETHLVVRTSTAPPRATAGVRA
jgi:DNA-binding LacI/PurR family transcriptional regulator